MGNRPVHHSSRTAQAMALATALAAGDISALLRTAGPGLAARAASRPRASRSRQVSASRSPPSSNRPRSLTRHLAMKSGFFSCRSSTKPIRVTTPITVTAPLNRAPKL